MMSYLVLAVRKERRVEGRSASSLVLFPTTSTSNSELTKVNVLERIERSPLAVDSHLLLIGQSQSLHLGDVLDGLHVGSVASGSEDDSDFGGRVDVIGGDESSGGVVDESREGDGDVLIF